jgi:hydrogenase expression/formation protein HypD
VKFVDEFKDPEIARQLVEEIHRKVSRPWRIMEVCGGQTHSIIKNGIDKLLPDEVSLIHGPGCPVCVTPVAMIDKALAIASQPGVLFCSFGDMLRVPGTKGDLFQAKAKGAQVRVVYSPLDALRLAEENPSRQVVFFAIGFETTAPANAMAVWQARQRGVRNFSLLVSHVLVPPAIEAILSDPRSRVEGFLAAGHVCSVMGTWQYGPLVERYRVPIVVAGFEPLDLLEAIRRVVVQLEAGRARLENAYPRAVSEQGNRQAQAMLAQVFEVCDRRWRGLGTIPASGWRLADAYRDFDAEERFGVGQLDAPESPECHSGEVLQGLLRPDQCPAFAKTCTPANPLGATMVSSEGACAAYYHYRRYEILGAGGV